MKLFESRKFLPVYSGVLTVAFGASMLSGFTSAGQGAHGAKFDTITVQRINIVEPDGTPRMVLTNNQRIPGIIINGHEYADYTERKKGTTAGIYFYDGDGTESGGLTFGGERDAQGNISRFGHFAFDRYNQDQMFTITAEDDGTNFGSAIRMIDRPSWSLEEYLQLLDTIQHLPQAERDAAIAQFFETHPQDVALRTMLSSVKIPENPSANSNGLQLNDTEGRNRARLLVGGDGAAALEFLDVSGNVTHRYPPN